MTEYDTTHRAERARQLRNYTPGGTPCFLCGKPMTDPPAKLQLAHAHDRTHPHRHTGPRGLAHQRCNIGDAGRLAQRRLRGHDPPPRPRRQW